MEIALAVDLFDPEPELEPELEPAAVSVFAYSSLAEDPGEEEENSGNPEHRKQVHSWLVCRKVAKVYPASCSKHEPSLLETSFVMH